MFKYSEYKIENLYLVENAKFDEKGKLFFDFEKEMSEADKLAFIKEVFPGYDQLEDELMLMKQAIEDEEIKQTKWGQIHIKSFEAWGKRNDISYIRTKKTKYSNSSEIYIACEYINASDTYHLFPNHVLYKMKDVKTIFKNIIFNLYDKEVKYKKDNEEKIYRDTNAARIDQSKKVKELLSDFRCDVPVSIHRDGMYSVRYESDIVGFNYSHYHKRSIEEKFHTNNYGEIVFNNGNETLLSLDQVKELEDILLKYGRKIAVLLDDLKDEMAKIVEDK